MMDWVQPWMALPLAGSLYYLLWWLEKRSNTRLGRRIHDSSRAAWQDAVDRQESKLSDLLEHGRKEGWL